MSLLGNGGSGLDFEEKIWVREALLLLACPGLVSFASQGSREEDSGLVPLHGSNTAQSL